jgi:hypothetical protein
MKVYPSLTKITYFSPIYLNKNKPILALVKPSLIKIS